MDLLRLVLRTSGSRFVLSIVAGGIAGVANSALLMSIHNGLSGESFFRNFAIACLVFLVGAFGARTLTARLSNEAVLRTRLDIVESILDLPLRSVERMGPGKLVALLTEDVMILGQVVTAFALVTVEVLSLTVAVGYLAWLSWRLFAAMLVVSLVGVGLMSFTQRGIMNVVRTARDHTDSLQNHLTSVLEGMKELKLNSALRGRFIEHSVKAEAMAVASHQLRADVRMAGLQSVLHLIAMFFIATTLAIGNRLPGVTPHILSGFVLTVLFVLGPFETIQSFLPAFNRATVALERIQALRMALAEDKELLDPNQAEPKTAWKTIFFDEVRHSYHSERDASKFTLGPIDYELVPGQVVFIIGGNGSGKSTFAKILTGLYTPERGTIFLDGVAITEKNREWYRQHFTAIFADYHVFDDVGELTPAELQRAQDYLTMLQLDQKVAIVDGRFTTTTELSTGQRKRLALLRAYLEDRPICVFDEWASDQDPMFKHVFYTRLLADLKARGKSVLVITHDEAYFPCADKIVKVDMGRLADEATNAFMTRLKSSHSMAPPVAKR